ncbi:MAG: double zinc ribbon domain-containing protein [Stellaceae bacterium]
MTPSATLAIQALGRLRRLARGLVDVVLPPRCLACGTAVEEADALCGRCWGAMTFFAPPWCAGCGLPFAHPLGDGAVCADCARAERSWDRARSVLRYDKNSRGLILGLKHADHTHLAGAFGRWMLRAGGEVLGDADLLVPVPLHWSRLARRRYNQAALLAHAIRGAGGPPVAADWICRRRRTPVQGHMGPAARARNVQGAFAVRGGRSLTGRRVVLIDDVLTTGATVDECARILKRAGAASVGVLTLARALRAGA